MDCSGKYTFFLLLLVVGCYIHSGSGAYDLLLSCGNSVVSGSDCTMTCDTKTTTETVIQWLNGSTATVIDKNVDCTDGGGLPYESSCNTPGKFDLKITNAQYGRDSYAWSCTSPFGGGVQSNATDGNTFVTVPLTSVTLTRSSEGTSISCVAVCSPSATVTLYEGSPPSQDTVIVTESSFTKTTEGLETSLTSTVDESKTYYCHADNGVDAPVNSAPSVSVVLIVRLDYGETGACSAGGGTHSICIIVLLVVKWKFPRSEKSQEKKHSKKWKPEHADKSSTEYKDLVMDFEIEVKRTEPHVIFFEVKSVKQAGENEVDISYLGITSPHVTAKGILHIIVIVLSVICILLGVICLITVLAATNCPLDQTNCKVNLALSIVVLLLGAACLALSWLLRDYHYDWKKYRSNRGGSDTEMQPLQNGDKPDSDPNPAPVVTVVGETNQGNNNSTGNGGNGPNGKGNGGNGPNGTGNGGNDPNGTGNGGNDPNGTGNRGNGLNGTGNRGNGPNGTGNGGNGPNGTGNGGNGSNGTGNGGNDPNGTEKGEIKQTDSEKKSKKKRSKKKKGSNKIKDYSGKREGYETGNTSPLTASEIEVESSTGSASRPLPPIEHSTKQS